MRPATATAGRLFREPGALARTTPCGKVHWGLWWPGLPSALLAALLVTPAALAASPDCARPGNATERAICRDPVLRQADATLVALAEALRQSPEQQQEWTRRRNRMCPAPGREACLALAYAERTAYLRAQLEASPATPDPLALPATLATLAPPVATVTLAVPATRATPVPPAAPVAPVPLAAPAVPAAAPEHPSQPVPAIVPARAAPPTPSVVSDLAQQLAGAACPSVSSTALRGLRWSASEAPFGIPLRQWTRRDFAALIARSDQCQAENGDSPRNVQAMGQILGQLRAMAPETAAPRPPPPKATAPVPAEAAAPAQQVVSLDCADPALLRDVALTYQTLPQEPADTRLLRLHTPRAYTDVILEAYRATPALQAEYQQMQPYMAPMPQCLVNATTSHGETTLSYRLYAEGGRTLVEVRRVP